MKKRIACLLSFLLSLYTCTALARHQQLMHNVYDTQESQSKVKEGANKQVISSQADSLIKISRIWADFFPANTSNQPI
ncbi:hypothetical protein V2U54_28220 [Klebsiella pneumoniae]|uniref:hypothetical protein n=1 Tax=Klebsiella pneumoniae TaxID=573 RepID=UPI002ED19443|nr:hypothetical protein [Klebsiella pneumoniae]